MTNPFTTSRSSILRLLLGATLGITVAASTTECYGQDKKPEQSGASGQDEVVTGESITVFFAPFDAPYISGEYNTRINFILASLSPLGQRSGLERPTIDLYKERIANANIPDYKITGAGKLLLIESASWLLDKYDRPTRGFAKFRESYVQATAAASFGNQEDFKKKIVDLFYDSQAFRYFGAQRVVRGLAADQLLHLSRSLREIIGSTRIDDYVLFPSPDDLDIAVNWRPLFLSAAGREGTISGLATYVDVFIPPVDSILENLIKSDDTHPFYMPSKLLFVKNLTYTPSVPISTQNNPILVDLPPDRFENYMNSSGAGSAVMFLMAVELRRRHV